MKTSLLEMGFVKPTPVQESTIPVALAGKDVVGTAQTGTGKTAAFVIPMLAKIYLNPGKIGLILAPTRELATQIHKVIRQISKSSNIKGSLVVGGESFRRQAKEIEKGVDYIVATPGRLNDHLKEGTANLENVSVLILDEVDRMLDMGFLPQIKDVVKQIPIRRQTLLFSATLPSEVVQFINSLVTTPVRVKMGDASKPSTQVKETIRKVTMAQKPTALLEELKTRQGKVLIFVRTQSKTHRLFRLLEKEGVAAICLHGGLTQAQRKQALESFRKNPNSILVATDLAGRGLDIHEVDLVVNFDIPSSRDEYIHRIGRTGRADRKGEALSFVVPSNPLEEQIITGKRPAPAKPKGPLMRFGRPVRQPEVKKKFYYNGPSAKK